MAYEEALQWAVQVVNSATAPGDPPSLPQQQQLGGPEEAASQKLSGVAALEAAFKLFGTRVSQGISRSGLGCYAALLLPLLLVWFVAAGLRSFFECCGIECSLWHFIPLCFANLSGQMV